MKNCGQGHLTSTLTKIKRPPVSERARFAGGDYYAEGYMGFFLSVCMFVRTSVSFEEFVSYKV